MSTVRKSAVSDVHPSAETEAAEAPGVEADLVDANRYPFTGGVFASYDDGTTSPTLADWQARSGQDRLATSY